jgi:hypothetical protein
MESNRFKKAKKEGPQKRREFMRAIFLAYLVMFSRHLVRAYFCHYSDNLSDWWRSVSKMRTSFGVIDDPPSRDV